MIPAINVKTFEEVQERIKIVESLRLEWAHLDIFDGVFTNLYGFNDPKRIRELETDLNLEAHLMTWMPEEHIEDWFVSGVRRIIFHWEASHKKDEIIREAKEAGLEVGISLKPYTPWRFAEIFLESVDLIQILGVNPGPYGQRFMGEEVIEKIRTLKKYYPDVIIETDGGVNDTNAKVIVEAGADILVVGSYLFESDNPKGALAELRAAADSKP